MIARSLAVWAAASLSLALGLAPARGADDSFLLRDGDRVVFYGDSITEQRLYTLFTETFAVTRFPTYHLSFTHSGWGGDRANGGGGGSIDRRLARDVIAYRPTVVTIMLGMNDGSYRAFDQAIFDRYESGYRHIVEELKLDLPGVRLTLIKPSPYDDVTREPKFEGGYNAVLLRYADFVARLAGEVGATVADLNNPVVEATRKAMEIDKGLAEKLNPDRVHPGAGGQLLMAQALLRAWHAPSLVSAVNLDAKDSRVVSADKAEVTNLVRDGETITWTQLDAALPFPTESLTRDRKDPVVALALKAGNFQEELNRELLKVDGLSADEYTLRIDGEDVGTFSKDDLGAGLNLARLTTPMSKQSGEVHRLSQRHVELHHMRWRTVQIPFERASSEHLGQALAGLDGIEEEIVAERHKVAQPKPHKFELKPKSSEAPAPK